MPYTLRIKLYYLGSKKLTLFSLLPKSSGGLLYKVQPTEFLGQ